MVVVPITPETDIEDRGWSIDLSADRHLVYPGVWAPATVRAWGELANLPGVQANAVSYTHLTLPTTPYV